MRPVVLVIRDGWGESADHLQDASNAVRLANVPCSNQLERFWPTTYLITHGLDVGLPEGVMGNSEVGHQNIGAGRIVDQERVLIDKAFANKTLYSSSVLKKAFDHCQERGTLHFMGLLSDGGVHSILDHLFGLWHLAVHHGVKKIILHAFMDGRDTPPMSGLAAIQRVNAFITSIKVGKIGTLMGRFWAMDRDQRWDRVSMAYHALTNSLTTTQTDLTPEAFLKDHYLSKPKGLPLSDEFIEPVIFCEGEKPIDRIKSGDSVIFFNFRGDRPRELVHAFLDESFNHFEREKIQNLYFSTLTNYESGLCENVVFDKPEKMKNILGEVVANAGLKQFRCAETEKYPHVTFFFNDYREAPFVGEERCLIPSPRHVKTYDQMPEMSALAVTQAVVKAILSQAYALIIVNYANPDMVGHTGSLEATIKACEAVDQGLSDILKAVDQVDGIAMITADHGNAELMWDFEANAPHTRHTTNLVSFTLYGRGCENVQLREGSRLADIAPTILDCLHLQKPVEMTGVSLLV